MSTLNLTGFTDITTIEQIADTELLALLRPHADYLCSRGLAWPCAGERLNREALIVALLALDEHCPSDLIDALYLIRSVASSGQVFHLLALAESCGIDRESIASSSVLDMVVRLWLRRPDMIRRVAAEIELPHARRFDAWHVAGRDRSLLTEVPSAEQLRAWEAEIDSWMRQHHHGGGATVIMSERGDRIAFVIRHGATLQRVAVHAEQATSMVFRPSVHDVILYDRITAELNIHVHGNRERVKAFLCASFARHILGVTDAMQRSARYSLDPLRDHGAGALTCDDTAALIAAELVELECAAESEVTDLRVRYHASDVFAALRFTAVSVAQYPQLRQARIRLHLSDATTRTVTIRPPNVALFERDGDTGVIDEWLRRRGFIVPVASDASHAAA